MPRLQANKVGEVMELRLTFHRVNDPLVTYAVWYSEDLVDWGSAPVWQATGAHEGTPGLFEVMQPTTSKRGFLRLTVGRSD